MSDIINYKFYLKFTDIGLVEITEPTKFDGLSFIIEQDNKRYGRDVFKMNEGIDLEFYKGNFEPTETMQELPNGTPIFYLTQGFEYLIDEYQRNGFESVVEFVITLDGVDFVTGVLDFATAETDLLSYIKCKIIDNGQKQLLKRRADVSTDLFSTEDLDGNAVTPIDTENILLKAKPIVQESEWSINTEKTFFYPFQSGGSGRLFFNDTPQITKQEIQNTLSYLPYYDAVSINTDIPNSIINPSYIDAIADLTSVIISIDLNAEFKKIAGNGTAVLRLKYKLITDFNNIQNNTQGGDLMSVYTINDSNTFVSITENTQTPTIIPNGARLVIYFENRSSYNGGGNTEFKIINFKINIKATATSVDTVIKGSRYIDVIKGNLKRLNGFNVNAIDFDINGKYYNQYAFSGNLIKQRTDVPFTVKFNQLMNDLQELNQDYQILKDKLYIAHYNNYYPDNEIGAFLTSTDDTFTTVFNDRYTINEFNYKYKTFEQDRDESNTTDAIHTETQWLTANTQVENKKDISINYIRDAFKIEVERQLAAKETTSTSEDDKLFLLDVVPLAPTARGGFSATLAHNITNGNLQLLKDNNIPSWNVLGIAVGGGFKIDAGANVGTYTIIEITDTIITLSGVNSGFSGNAFTVVSYPFNNVAFTNRTNEGLIEFENLLNADNFSNLKYSIKRNLTTWQSYLASCNLYKPNGSFKNTYFKSNGECATRFNDEPQLIKEKESILNSDFEPPILTPIIYNTRLVIGFNDALNVINSINTINQNNTIGGFIRCIDTNNNVVKLYPKAFEFEPSTNTLTLEGEQRFESDIINLIVLNNGVIINNVTYTNEELSAPFYEYKGNKFTIYDNNTLPIINPTDFSKFVINGNTFNSSSAMLGYLVDVV